MRTIKFRGKDADTGEWLVGDIIQKIGYFPSILFPYNSNGKIHYSECAVDAHTIGQFTGLFDKNEKEIYEGDILEWGKGEHKSTPLIVCFKHGSFGYIYCDCFHSLAGNPNFTFNPLNTDVRFEVIGNIHDDPELLKGGEK